MNQVEYLSKQLMKTYRCEDSLDNFLIRIRLQIIDSSGNVLENFIETLKWQEKLESPSEVKKNQKTVEDETEDRQRTHHSKSILFSYTNEDSYKPIDDFADFVNLQNVETLNDHEENFLEYDFIRHLKNSIENPFLSVSTESMHIMADFGEFYDTTWLKNEFTLCTISFDHKRKVLSMKPDYGTYKLRIENSNFDTNVLFVEYCIENASNLKTDTEIIQKEGDLIRKVHNIEKKSEILNFPLISSSEMEKISLFVDILTGEGFQNGNLFVKYYIDVPNEYKLCPFFTEFTDLSTENDRKKCFNSTFSSKKLKGSFHFVSSLEIHFEKPSDIFMNPIVYFEVISKDSWLRFRSEGIGYLIVPIHKAGHTKHIINCFRLTDGSLRSNLKRFFIGDSSNYSDLSSMIINTKDDNKIVNRLDIQSVSSGSLLVSTNIVVQRKLNNTSDKDKDRKAILREKLVGSESLTKSIDELVDAFKEAQKAMREERK